MTTRELFARHAVVAFDRNVIICLLEGTGTLADIAAAIVDGIEDGQASGVLASIGLTEILARPASLDDVTSFEETADELRSLPNMRVVPLDAETAIDAAWGRSAGRGFGDALHMAAARRAGATCFLTNDARIRGRAGVEVVGLSDIDLPPVADVGVDESRDAPGVRAPRARRSPGRASLPQLPDSVWP